MKILLTGASGYLGGHVLHALKEAGHEVRAVTHSTRHLEWIRTHADEVVAGDLRDYASLRKACHGIQGLVHCAALLGAWRKIDQELVDVNVIGTAHLLRAADRSGVGKVVHVSSVVAVGCTRDGKVLNEDAPWAQTPQPPIPYLRSKREAEGRVMSGVYAGMPITIVNPGSMLGPHAQDGRVKGHVAEVLKNPGQRIFPGGSTVAGVKQTAQGVVAALDKGRVGERYLLGGHNLTWFALRNEIAKAARVAPPAGVWPGVLGQAGACMGLLVEMTPLSRPRFARDRYRAWGWYSYADSSKAQRELGYRIVPLEEIVSEAVDACRTASLQPAG
ncbi:MAG: NAD-dependent epimerase/dehydratase family protein [Planctomycetota bacterium]